MAVASSPETHEKFLKATSMLGPQIEQLLKRNRPDCLVVDVFFLWATDVAAKYGIPSLIFHGTSYIALCTSLCMYRYEPHKRVSSEYEPFIIPNLPDEIEFTASRVPDFLKEDAESEFINVIYKESKEAESRSYGVLVNSFYELEPAYADHYTNVLGIKAWHIGPLFLYDKGTTPKEKAERGILEASIDDHQCSTWLDSKKPNSVIYVCFGSLTSFSDKQLMEIAMGLEDSGQQFIWVVQKEIKRQGFKEEWLPEGLEERMEGRGLIIRGWAPQVVILEHEAVGAFVTHCGWNSTLEGVCAGLPMVAWPVSAEQFYNEKLVTQILGIGIGVGVRTWSRDGGDFVRREVIEQAVRRVMEGEEAVEMRSKSRGLAEMARRAIEEGGSSYLDLDALFEELSLARIARDSSQGEFVTR
ncbi:UDP-glucuronosyl/UDP-glucosyltransferase [Trema orientale]|uniref:Glycosyltransferase n=1 Tax=Trema orientale TaxID=63057 RepID=A0A2P5ERH7_TREOI|nr:UDP-glucuronosyl/UDP-glucosyltransferase [Trema orientale]